MALAYAAASIAECPVVPLVSPGDLLGQEPSVFVLLVVVAAVNEKGNMDCSAVGRIND